MSCFDKVDMSVLSECCILSAQRRIQSAVTGNLLACECGAKLEFDGRWRLAQDEFRAEL